MSRHYRSRFDNGDYQYNHGDSTVQLRCSVCGGTSNVDEEERSHGYVVQCCGQESESTGSGSYTSDFAQAQNRRGRY